MFLSSAAALGLLCCVCRPQQQVQGVSLQRRPQQQAPGNSSRPTLGASSKRLLRNCRAAGAQGGDFDVTFDAKAREKTLRQVQGTLEPFIRIRPTGECSMADPLSVGINRTNIQRCQSRCLGSPSCQSISVGFASEECLLSDQAQADNRARRWVSNKHCKAPTAGRLVGRAPKLAIMMMVGDQIDNLWVWTTWVDDAARMNLPFTFMIHTDSKVFTPKSLGAHAQYFQFVKGGEAGWCNFHDAQVQMIRTALADPAVTHMLMVSDNSVPVKSLQYIYSDLAKAPESRFCGDNHWWLPRAESWWVMEAADARLFADEMLQGTLREFRAKRVAFAGEKLDCNDENEFYWPLLKRWERVGNEARIRNECTMFTDWTRSEEPCKHWGDHTSLCECPSLLTEPNVTKGNRGHPAAYHHLNSTSLFELFRSPFWFARKFTEQAISRGSFEGARRLLQEGKVTKGLF